MTDWLHTQIQTHPMTCLILALYTGNIIWYASQNRPGLAFYWLAAGQITIAATWLRDWRI